MEERVFKLSLKEAKEWYKSDDNTKKDIALKLFTKEELEKIELPKTWEEFERINSNKPTHLDFIIYAKHTSHKWKAAAKLEILMDYYRQGWLPDWKADGYKYYICLSRNEVVTSYSTNIAHFLSFQSPILRNEFLENFRDLIKQAGDLI